MASSDAIEKNEHASQFPTPWKLKAAPITLAGLRGDGQKGEKFEQAYWESVLFLEDLAGCAGEFDGRTFEPLGQGTSSFYRVLHRYLTGEERSKRDFLLRLSPYLLHALAEIEQNPRTRLGRRYEELPLHKVQDQDTRCLMKLSRRPGRTATEKAAQTGKAPAVVRYESLDTPENRLVRRVVGELYRALRARKEADEQRGLQADWQAKSPAMQLFNLCRRMLLKSEFGELEPGVVVEPNNTLLGDRAYNTVFRAFRAFRRRQEEFEKSWKQAIYAAPSTVGWALGSRLAQSQEWTSVEGLGQVVFPAEEGAPFTLLAGEPWFFKGGDAPEALEIKVGEEEGQQTLILQRWGFKGDGLVIAEEPDEVWRAHILQSEKEPEGWRGIGLLIGLVKEGSDEVWSREFFFDRQGVNTISQWIYECLELQYTPQKELANHHHGEALPYRRVGVDYSAARIKALASDRHGSEEFVDGGLFYARTMERRDKDEIKSVSFVADAASRAIYSGEHTMHGQGIRRVWQGEQADLALEEAAAQGLANIGASTELALLMADDADEVQLQRFRRLLPRTQASRWILWRSVAAALAWRKEPGGAGKGLMARDAVVVIDTSGVQATATMLIGRQEALSAEEENSASEDRWYWERTAPFVAGASGATTAAFRERLAWELVSEDCPVELVDRLIDEGHLDQVRAGQIIEVPLFIESRPAFFQRRICPELLQKVRQKTEEEFTKWIQGDFIGAMEKAVWPRMEREGGELHILFIGDSAKRQILSDLISRAAVHGVELTGAELLRGAVIFLERHADGLPTWRDMIPALQLEVGGRRWIDLIDPAVIKEGVRPGQALSYRPLQTFELPAEAESIDLPMRSKVSADGQEAESYTALIQDEVLPLNRAIDVRLEVVYHYAQDEFRIRILPTRDEVNPPFEVFEIQWMRGEESGPEREIRNEPPEFPESLSWENIAWGAEELLGEHRKKLEAMLKDKFLNRTQLDGRLKKQAPDVVKDFKALEKLISRELTDLLKEVIPVGRTLESAPPNLQGELDGLQEILLELAKVSAGGKKKKNKKKKGGNRFPHRQIERAKNTQVDGAMRRLQECALSALGRFRHLSDAALLAVLVDGLKRLDQLRSDEIQPRFEAYGRALGDVRDKDRREYFDGFLMELHRFASQALKEDKPDPNLRHYLWALATGLWGNEFTVQQLTKEQAERLLKLSLELAEKLDEEWHQEPVSIEIFRELVLVILALLRLRGTESEELVHAESSQFCKDLAELMESIDDKLGGETSARIDVGDADQQKSAGQLVAANLRGYEISRIQIKED